MIGGIHHTIRAAASYTDSSAAAPSCTVGGKTSTSLKFSLAAATPTAVSTVVRTSRDPSCVARLIIGSSPLCGLTNDTTTAATAIAKDFASVTLSQARLDHASHWASFWNVSSISLPGAAETEAFWYGALYVLNSAIPHAGQDQTPPGLYGPWGTIDNPGTKTAPQLS